MIVTFYLDAPVKQWNLFTVFAPAVLLNLITEATLFRKYHRFIAQESS
jgi:hypothetical protein